MQIEERSGQGVTFAGICRAVCPYYDHESRFSVTCEGPVENTLASIKFTAEKALSYSPGLFCSHFVSRFWAFCAWELGLYTGFVDDWLFDAVLVVFLLVEELVFVPDDGVVVGIFKILPA